MKAYKKLSKEELAAINTEIQQLSDKNVSELVDYLEAVAKANTIWVPVPEQNDSTDMDNLMSLQH